MAESRWFPTSNQLKEPGAIERAFRQLLIQHYTLVDQHNTLANKVGTLAAKSQPRSGPPPGSGPTDSMLLGLPVTPVDSQTLTDGATLKFSKKTGTFTFS